LSSKKLVLIITASLIVFVSTFSGAVYAEEGVSVEVEGISPIVNDDRLLAEEMAVTDALRKAVEQVLGALIDNQTNSKNYQLIQDTIKVKSSGYVSRQTVLKRWIEDGYYKVLVRAVVKRDALRQSVDALQLTLVRAGKPRLLFLIDEPKVTARIAQGMINSGFPVVDPAYVEKNGPGFKSFAQSEKKLSELASAYQAEIIVTGSISKEPAGETDGIVACRAYLSLRAVRADTGQSLVSQTFNDRGVDINQDSAFQKALLKISDRAVVFLREELGKQLVDNARTIQITLNGVNYTELQQFQRRLKATPNVSNVFLRGFSNGNALLDLETGLLADQLAEFISGWTDLNLEITGISGSKINLIHN
jgi:hypothetical protein